MAPSDEYQQYEIQTHTFQPKLQFLQSKKKGEILRFVLSEKIKNASVRLGWGEVDLGFLIYLFFEYLGYAKISGNGLKARQRTGFGRRGLL